MADENYFSTSPLKLGGSDTRPNTGGLSQGLDTVQVPDVAPASAENAWSGGFGNLLGIGLDFGKSWLTSTANAKIGTKAARAQAKALAAANANATTQSEQTRRIIILAALAGVALIVALKLIRRK